MSTSAQWVRSQGRPQKPRGPRIDLETLLLDASCPACAERLAVPFYDGGVQPLTTLAWPRSSAEAQAMPGLPLDFVRCVGCGHVFNRGFRHEDVPYSTKPNLMFNRGALWKRHLEKICDRLVERLPSAPTVLEIGCGDGHLLRALADRRPDGRYHGYDLNGGITHAGGAVKAYASRFEPRRHVHEHRPDLIISRHLLEHLNDPLGFVRDIDFAVTWEGTRTRLFLEVPCIDRLLETPRTADFFYEHNSHFTTGSFECLLRRGTAELDFVEHGYNDEVVYGLARLGRSPERVEQARQALHFHARARDADEGVRSQLAELAETGLSIAIWGGTGKAAGFINRNALDALRFPVVVDSDIDKVGTYVPGTGQPILAPDTLLAKPVDVIVIATQWRAQDIVVEIEAADITADRILLEHDGRLVDYFGDPHPYRWCSDESNQ